MLSKPWTNGRHDDDYSRTQYFVQLAKTTCNRSDRISDHTSNYTASQKRRQLICADEMQVEAHKIELVPKHAKFYQLHEDFMVAK